MRGQPRRAPPPALLATVLLLPPHAAAPLDLTILHWNDVHARVELASPYQLPPYGGYARLAAHVKSRVADLTAA
eukprot:gene49135-50355_t